MKNNFFIIFLVFLLSISLCWGQFLGVEYVSPNNITLRFNHIEITDVNGVQKIKKTNSMIVYYPSGFTLVSDEGKIYTFLVPGTEFDNLKAISFIDTKLDILLDSADTVSAIIYQSTLRPYQIAHKIGNNGITLKKKDGSGIRLYEK